MQLCRFLRWKGCFDRPLGTEAALREVLQLNDVPYECLHTCRPWGPDDDVAALERCQPERSCFERSRRGPALVS